MDDAVKIKKIDIDAFGKLQNFSLELKEGLNIIFGDNEAGKSTLQLFIKAMFYGLPKRKKAGEALKERERAVPWGKTKASGSILFKFCGKDIVIRRDFGKTSADDTIEAYELNSGLTEKSLCREAPGEVLFNMNEVTFEKILWIKQNGVYMGGRDDTITKRLESLSSDGDETVSSAKAVDRLKAIELSLKAPTSKHLPGKIDILNNKLDELTIERYNLLESIEKEKSASCKTAELKKELFNVGQKIKSAEEKQKKIIESRINSVKLERYLKAKEYKLKIDNIRKSDEYRRCFVISDELFYKAESLNTSVDSLRDLNDTNYEKFKKRKNLSLTAIIVSLILVITIAAATALLTHKTENTTAFTLIAAGDISVLYIALILKRIKSAKTKRFKNEKIEQSQLDALIEAKSELISIFSQTKTSSIDELRSLHTAKHSFKERIDALKATTASILGDDTFEELEEFAQNTESPPEDSEEISNFLCSMRKKQLELTAEINKLSGTEEEDSPRTIRDIDIDIQQTSEEIKRYTDKLEAVRLAVSAINDASAKRQLEFTPRLNSSASEFLKILTLNKYKKISVGDDYKMRVYTENGYVAAEYLSLGAYEQIYLALRLALCDLTTDGFVLFMDDILTSYDNKRASNALGLFQKLGKNRQIILFLCREPDFVKSDEFDAHIINI